MFQFILRFFIVLVGGFFLVFSYMAYQYYVALHSDDPIDPYIYVHSGAATVVRGDTAIDMTGGEEYILQEKDIIMTRSASVATVHWPDHSTTVLGGDSRLIIEQMQLAEDYSSIQIALSLQSGKAWTHVTRTLYPGSFFRVKLPEGGIVAGVRGTTFDIDLTRGYIHSVDHGMQLSDRFGNSVTLLPGELVSAKNILQKLSQSVIDLSWSTWNQTQDANREAARAIKNTNMFNTLGRVKSGIASWIDDAIRSILYFFPSFAELRSYELIMGGEVNLEDISPETLLSVYQRVQDKKFVQEREMLRSALATKIAALPESTLYLESLARGALWDKIAYTGMTLPSADAIVSRYSETLDTQIQNVLKTIPLKEMDTKAKETLRSLIK